MLIAMPHREQLYKITIVAVVAVFSVGCSAARLHNSSGSHDNRPITSNNVWEHVTYDVYGPAGPTAPDPVGVTANINYVDIFGKPQRADNVRLPWRLIMAKLRLPSVNVNIVAQTRADQISCRIMVNDVVKAEKTVVKTGVRAETSCAVTA